VNRRLASSALVLNVNVHLVELSSVQVVEDMAEISSRSLHLGVFIKFDRWLSFVVVEEELVIVANSGERKEARRCCPAYSEAIFAVFVDLGLDWRAGLGHHSLIIAHGGGVLTPSDEVFSTDAIVDIVSDLEVKVSGEELHVN